MTFAMTSVYPGISPDDNFGSGGICGMDRVVRVTDEVDGQQAPLQRLS
jgi:hypothetical protein